MEAAEKRRRAVFPNPGANLLLNFWLFHWNSLIELAILGAFIAGQKLPKLRGDKRSFFCDNRTRIFFCVFYFSDFFFDSLTDLLLT